MNTEQEEQFLEAGQTYEYDPVAFWLGWIGLVSFWLFAAYAILCLLFGPLL